MSLFMFVSTVVQVIATEVFHENLEKDGTASIRDITDRGTHCSISPYRQGDKPC